MIIARWVNQLAAPKENDATARRGSPRAESENEEVFAADRNRSGAARVSKGIGADTKMRAASVSTARTGPAPGVGESETEPQEFPIPFAISGVKPNPAVPKNSSPPPAKQTAGAATSKSAASKTAAHAAIPADGDDDDTDEVTPPKTKAKTGDSKQPAKPFKLDPKLLERTLQFRNANRPSPN